jgi:hypothetical protein
MGRSIKHIEYLTGAHDAAGPDPRPGTEKGGACLQPDIRPRSRRQEALIRARRGYGRTEKILRRNRALWSRMFAKEGRRLDKEEIAQGLGLQ